MRISVSLLPIALLTACVHREGTPYGSYTAYDMGLDRITPPVTLTVARSHRYRFCDAGRCVTGKWDFEELPTNGAGRIAFQGRVMEAFVIAFCIKAYGPDDFFKQRGVQGSIELDFSPGPLGQQITLGAGDAAFVRE